MAFDELTQDQASFIIRFMELIDSGDYEPEFNAAGAIGGWFVLIDGKNNNPGIQLDGYSKTMFEALGEEGYLTISYQSHDSFLASPRKKAYDEYTKMKGGGKIAVQALPAEPDIAHNVFVVHGRNKAIQNAMEDFLRKIDLRPIEWSEARKYTGKANPLIHEIVEAAFNKARAIVVLLTPEDYAKLHPAYLKADDSDEEITLSPQPRQNVLFELGMAMGRDEQRTILVQIGQLRKFSDLEGRHTVRMDNSPEKRHELAQRLIDAGCAPNLNGETWLSAGDFSLPPLEIPYDTTATPALELSAEETALLRAIAILSDNNEDAHRDSMADALGWKTLRMDFVAHNLDKKELSFLDENNIFVLTEKGVSYVMTNSLLEISSDDIN